jgi:hypothetical protein
MQLIESKTLGTAQASIEFTSIPQTFTDLVALVSVRSTRSLVLDDVYLSVNSITSGYTGRILSGSGSSATSGANAGAGDKFYFMLVTSAANATSNTFGNGSVYVSNYTGSTNKSFSFDSVSENNATEAYQYLASGLLSNTAAITSLTFSAGVGNLAVGSTISLYGVLKGSDGIVTTSP